ncbi:MAG: acyltransferase [Clostridia bacterium]|nr:acyltransferase [Clostridia bacterium]
MPSVQDEKLFWKKKEFISFLLCVLVFFIHISSIKQYAVTGGFITALNYRFAFFFKESITRFAVPAFFILSGISFFKSYDNTKYFSKIKSRVFTLVIPYLLWNTIWMLFNIFCTAFLSQYFTGRKPFVISFVNVLKGIFLYGCNGPFWFMLHLIILSFAAPLIYLLIRNKYVGMLTATTLAVIRLFAIRIPDSIIFFLIGAIIGKHFFDYATRKSPKIMQLLSIVFLVTYVILKNLFRESANRIVGLDTFVFVLAAFALWSFTDLFIDKINPKAIYSRSFAIYALHVNVSAIITELICLALPKNEWFAIPNFILTVILTLLSINLICTLLERFFPKVSAVLFGNRIKPILKKSVIKITE